MNEEIITIQFDEELLPVKKLSSGNIHCIYEHGKLRYLEYDGTEFLRMIYFAVRDEQWATAPYTIRDEIIEEKENGFSVSYTAIHLLNKISYKSDIKITAKNNFLSFSVNGEALSDFKKNRIGICLHHPVRECSGQNVTVIKPNGIEYSAQFPVLISPHQPFKEIKEMYFDIETNLKLHLAFQGDIFETEDQRNWSDASYKTYSTPLELPFPVSIKKGEPLQQQVAMTITSTGIENVSKKEPKEQRFAFPKIGYSRHEGERLTKDEIELLSQLPFDHYRVELRLFKNDWEKELEDALWEADQLAVGLELTIFCDENSKTQIAQLILMCSDEIKNIKSILPLQSGYKTSPVDLINLLKHELKEKAPHIKIGYGTNMFFAEINRDRPENIDFDFLSFPLNPQVHANDTRSIVENLGRQSDLIETVRSFAPGKQVYVSPITFKIPGEGDNDKRLHSSLGAIWTIHTIKNLAGAHALTFYHTKGYRGIIHQGEESEQSSVYHLLKKIKAFQATWILFAENSNHSVGDVVLENEDGVFLKIECINTDVV